MDEDTLSTIEERLLKQTEISTSADTDLDVFIKESVTAVEEATEKRETGIEASVERRRIAARKAGKTEVTSALESRRGFATNTAVIRDIRQRTQEELKDLDMREQEMLAMGASEDAAAIRQLKFQSLAFRQQSEQQAYSNLLSILSLQAGRKTEERLERAQTSQEEQAMANVALDYGVELYEDDTFESVVSRAKEVASDEKALTLDKLRQSIAESKARVADMGRGDISEEPLDDVTADMFAEAYLKGDVSFLAGLETNQQRATVLNRVGVKREEEIKGLVEIAEGYSDYTSFMAAVEESGIIYNETRSAEEAGKRVFGKDLSGSIEEAGVPILGTERKEERKTKEKETAQESMNKADRMVREIIKTGRITTDKKRELSRTIHSGFMSSIPKELGRMLIEKYGTEGFDIILGIGFSGKISEDNLNTLKTILSTGKGVEREKHFMSPF